MRIQRESSLAALLLVVLTLILVLPVVSCKNQTETTPIRIGGIYALTGKAATFGTWARNGVDLAVQEINAAGGINGRKIEHVVEDTQSETKNAVSAFEKLIAANKVNAAIGFVMSGESLACAPVAQRTKTVMVTPVAGTEELKTAGEYVFRTRESSLFQAHAIAEFAINTLKVKESGILYDNSANSIAYKDAFTTRFQELGGKISGEWGYDDGVTDFRPYLLRVQESKAPVVFAPGISTTIGRILKQSDELKVVTQWLSSAGIEDPKLFELAGNAANEVIFATSEFSVDAKSGRAAEFVANYRKCYNSDPSVYSANAYDTVLLLAECFRKGAFEGENLSKELTAIKNFPGASGSITFDQDGEVFKPTMLKKIDNGKFIPYRQEQ
jgi:branched-chain amino acid transport system substrate-binding protein